MPKKNEFAIFPKLDFPALSTQSLSFFRISIAILVLVDLCLRAAQFSEHYTEEGIAPIRWLADLEQNPGQGWSVFFFHFGQIWSLSVFVLIAISATGLLLGYRTKLFSILTWVLVVSLQARNPLILFGADMVLAVLLFWGMWLPLGRHWSFDSSKNALPEATIRSGATLGITIQVALIYWMNAITKGHVEWRGDFSAIERTLRIDYFSTSFGEYLLSFPELLQAGTRFTLLLEELVPFLLFFPFFRGNLKTAAVFTMVSFHLGMLGTTMHLGIFPYIGAIAWLPFLPCSFWEKFQKSKGRSSEATIIAPKTVSIICCLLMAFTVLWNVRHALKHDDPWYLPKSVNWIAKATRLQQRWRLFAPRVNTTDGWLVADAILKDGTHVDLANHGSPVDFARPEEISSRYHSCRDRTHLIYLFQRPDRLRIELFMDSLRNRWNAQEKNQVESIELFFMHEDNREPEKGVRRFQMWPYETEIIDDNPRLKEVPLVTE